MQELDAVGRMLGKNNFASNTKYTVTPSENCSVKNTSIGTASMSVTNVILSGAGMIELQPTAGGVDWLTVYGSNILIENFKLQPNGASRFNDAIDIMAGNNISVRNVQINLDVTINQAARGKRVSMARTRRRTAAAVPTSSVALPSG